MPTLKEVAVDRALSVSPETNSVPDFDCCVVLCFQKLGVELDAATKGWENSQNDLAVLRKERDDLRQQVRCISTPRISLSQPFVFCHAYLSKFALKNNA